MPSHSGFDPKLSETTGILPLTSMGWGLAPYAFAEEYAKAIILAA